MVWLVLITFYSFYNNPKMLAPVTSTSTSILVANHKREGVVSVSVAGETCRPTDAATIDCRTAPRCLPLSLSPPASALWVCLAGGGSGRTTLLLQLA